MIFRETEIAGAFVIELEPRVDERGFFARTWCEEEMRAHGLEAHLSQCSVSFNVKGGTLRGMHYQRQPHGEAKVVRCTSGAIHDVILDLRAESPSFRRWMTIVLSATNRLALYVPQGVAHGFLTLEDGVEVLYQMANAYVEEAASGVRWDDPAFAIRWPFSPSIISENDRSLPFWQR